MPSSSSQRAIAQALCTQTFHTFPFPAQIFHRHTIYKFIFYHPARDYSDPCWGMDVVTTINVQIMFSESQARTCFAHSLLHTSRPFSRAHSIDIILSFHFKLQFSFPTRFKWFLVFPHQTCIFSYLSLSRRLLGKRVKSRWYLHLNVNTVFHSHGSKSRTKGRKWYFELKPEIGLKQDFVKKNKK